MTAGCLADTSHFELDVGAFQPQLDGKLGLSSSTTTDVETIDLASQLAIDDADRAPYPRAALDLGAFEFAAYGFKTQSTGRGVVAGDFGDITAGSAVDSDLDFKIGQVRALWDCVDGKALQLGFGLAAEWVDVDFEVTEQVFDLKESIVIRQAIPLIAAHASLDLGGAMPGGLDLVPISVELSAAGLTARFRDLDGTLLDLEGLVRWRLGHFGLFAGWRHLLFQLAGSASDQSFDGNLTISGAVAGLTLRF